jgi:hypothetical protein
VRFNPENKNKRAGAGNGIRRSWVQSPILPKKKKEKKIPQYLAENLSTFNIQ